MLLCIDDGLRWVVVVVQVKPFNLREVKVIRDLNPSDVNKLISVSGMVTRTSNIIPDLRYGPPAAACQTQPVLEHVYLARRCTVASDGVDGVLHWCAGVQDGAVCV